MTRRPDATTADSMPGFSSRTVETPVGRLLLAATPAGLVRVAFELEDFDTVLHTLEHHFGPRVSSTPGDITDVAATRLDEYFVGSRQVFDLPLDFTLSAPRSGRSGSFRQKVQRSLLQIRYGMTRSYRETAEAAGSPGAVRAVGTACATNPLPVIVPCHRVVRSDGGTGGYRGGQDVKSALLELESHSSGQVPGHSVVSPAGNPAVRVVPEGNLL